MLDFGKKIITQQFRDGSVVKEYCEIEASHFTDHDTLLKDIIESLRVLNSGEGSKLTLEITKGKNNRYIYVERYKEIA